MKILVLALCAYTAFSAIESHRVTTNMPSCPFYENMFSGYLDVGGGKSHHYVYVESAGNPETDPLLVWFNGGPGCSSMHGFIGELGPCVFMEDSSTAPEDNKFSWHHNASVVFMESPAGVGFNKFDGDFEFTDENSSIDNLNALLALYKGFPELKKLDLYLTGESYAGLYVPWLSYRILDHNRDTSDPDTKINLAGITIGNAVTNWEFDTVPAMVDMIFAHGLIDQKL